MAENYNINLPVLEPASQYQEPCWVCGWDSRLRSHHDPLKGSFLSCRRYFCSRLIKGLMDELDSYLLVCPTCFAIVDGMAKHIIERQLRRPWCMRGRPLAEHLCNEVNALPNAYDPSPPDESQVL